MSDQFPDAGVGELSQRSKINQENDDLGHTHVYYSVIDFSEPPEIADIEFTHVRRNSKYLKKNLFNIEKRLECNSAPIHNMSFLINNQSVRLKELFYFILLTRSGYFA